MTNELEKHDPHVGSNIKLAMELWPNAMWTPALQTLWRAEFTKMKDQTMLEQSIKWIKPLFSSHQPEIKWVVQQYARFYETKFPKYQASVAQKSQIFHVAWKAQSKFGKHMVEYGCVCHSAADAHATARDRSGRVIANLSNTPEPTEEDFARDEREAIASLSILTRDELVGIITRLRAFGWCRDKLPGKIEAWNRKTLLMVQGGYLHDKDKAEAR